MNEKSYTNWQLLSDEAILKEIGAYIRDQRLKQNKTQKDLADAAAISRSTLSLLERGEPVTLPTLIQVLRVLQRLQTLEGFEINEVLSPLELAAQQHPKRQRSRKRSNESRPKQSDW